MTEATFLPGVPRPTSGGIDRAPDLRPEDWLIAGQKLLKDGGLRGLKLRRLAQALGATTGSFYHHFTDFERYQAALAGFFAGAQLDPVLAAIDRSGLAPVDRIRAFADHARQHDMARLAVAMRAWARSDRRAAIAVRQHDDMIMAYLVAWLVDQGFTPAEAMIRSYALLAVGLGEVHPPDGLSEEALRGGLMALLCA